MRYKYPRTYHLPYSASVTKDDRQLTDDSCFYGKNVIVSEKMDGENISIYQDGFHARSLDSKHREYHSWLISYIQNFMYDLPNGDWRICGEYLYAKHSIGYHDLPSYFMGFSLWHNDVCQDWNTTAAFFNKHGIVSVPVLYKGIYDTKTVKKIAEEVVERGGEGVVVRNQDSFTLNEWQDNIAKYVRPNHVQTDEHWQYSKIEKNELKK